MLWLILSLSSVSESQMSTCCRADCVFFLHHLFTCTSALGSGAMLKEELWIEGLKMRSFLLGAIHLNQSLEREASWSWQVSCPAFTHACESCVLVRTRESGTLANFHSDDLGWQVDSCGSWRKRALGSQMLLNFSWLTDNNFFVVENLLLSF